MQISQISNKYRYAKNASLVSPAEPEAEQKTWDGWELLAYLHYYNFVFKLLAYLQLLHISESLVS